MIHGKFRYPRGGDKSHQLVDLFAVLKGQFPKQVHFIPGNHEMAQWTNRPVLKADENLNALFQDGVMEAYGPQFGPQIYDAYLELFQAIPVVIRTSNRVVVSHSQPTPASSHFSIPPAWRPQHTIHPTFNRAAPFTACCGDAIPRTPPPRNISAS